MSSGEVLRFPVQTLNSTAKTFSAQLELFDDHQSFSKRIAFLNPDEFSQMNFFSLIARNRFNLIIDYRPRPIFRRPKFVHREVTTYLHQKNIGYVELARYAQRIDGHNTNIVELIRRDFEKAFSSSSIFLLGLWDEAACESGIVDAFRAGISGNGNAIVEVHPSSLLR